MHIAAPKTDLMLMFLPLRPLGGFVVAKPGGLVWSEWNTKSLSFATRI
jgi:hypothetical protein